MKKTNSKKSASVKPVRQTKVQRLRDELLSLFVGCEANENDDFDFLPHLRGSDAFEDAFKAVTDLLRTLLLGNDKRVAITADFLETVERGLDACYLQPRYYWTVRQDITDAEILAAERDILAGDADALQHLRDPGDAGGMYYLEDWQNREALLQNLRYLMTVLAHYAKRYASFPAAREFLLAHSALRKMDDACSKEAWQERVTAIADHIANGADELGLAQDYASLKPWATFRAREAKLSREQLTNMTEEKRTE